MTQTAGCLASQHSGVCSEAGCTVNMIPGGSSRKQKNVTVFLHHTLILLKYLVLVRV